MIKISKIYKYFILMILFFGIEYYKFFCKNETYENVVRLIMAFVIIAMSIYPFTKSKMPKYLIRLNAAILVFAAISIFKSFVTYGSLLPSAGMAPCHLFLLLSVPVFFCLQRKSLDIRSLFTVIVAMSIISMALKYAISYINTNYGMELFKCVYEETAKGAAFRNGVIRISPSPFYIGMIPMIMWLLNRSKSVGKKYFYICLIVFTNLYMINIYNSRIIMVVVLAEVVIFEALRKKTSIKNIVFIILLFGALAFVVQTDQFNNFISTFSADNNLYGRSTASRIYSISYFWNIYKEHFLLGLGYVSRTDLGIVTSIQSGHLSDLGIFYTIYQMGIPMIIIYFILFYRGLTIGIKIKRVDNINGCMILTLTAGLAASSLLTDCFYNRFSIAMPFYIATIEYIYWCYRNNVKIKEDNKV